MNHYLEPWLACLGALLLTGCGGGMTPSGSASTTEQKTEETSTKGASTPNAQGSSGTEKASDKAAGNSAASTQAVAEDYGSWPAPNPKRSGLPNIANYTVEGDIVKDNVTGLMWQRKAPSTMFQYEEATAYCKSLALGSTSGWRVPSAIELLSIVDFTRSNPAIDTTTFLGVITNKADVTVPNAAGFWTSSQASEPQDELQRYYIYFTDGNRSRTYATGKLSVRCVASGTPVHNGENRFTVSGKEALDNVTKLRWQQERLTIKGEIVMNLVTAKAECKRLGEGWRVPSIMELLTLMGARRIPSLKADAFPLQFTGEYWSSTPMAGTQLFWSTIFLLKNAKDDSYTAEESSSRLSVLCVH